MPTAIIIEKRSETTDFQFMIFNSTSVFKTP